MEGSFEALSPPSATSFHQWQSRAEYILTSISVCIGLGNWWRFPHVVFMNGGGAFLWIYTVVLFLIGTSIYLLEVTVGQMCQVLKNPIHKCFPISRAVGFLHVAAALSVAASHHIVMSYCLLYIIYSLQTNVPWVSCLNPLQDGSFICADPSNDLNDTYIKAANTTKALLMPEDYFWWHHLMRGQTSLGYQDGWAVTLGEAILVFLCAVICSLFFPIRLHFKGFLFLLLLPAGVTLGIVRSVVLLPGAKDGLLNLFAVDDVTQLTSWRIWLRASEHAAYTLGLGTGVVLLLSSHNPLFYNICRTNVVIVVADYACSVLAAIIVFCSQGYAAHVTRNDFYHLADNSVGLIFSAYPRAFRGVGSSSIWIAAWFLSLLLLGLKSEAALLDVCIRNLCLMWAYTSKWQKAVPPILIQFFFFLMLPSLKTGGIFYAEWLDNFCGSLSLVIIAAFEFFYYRVGYGRDKFEAILHYTFSGFNNVVTDFFFIYILPIYFSFAVILGIVDFALGLQYVGTAHYCGWTLLLGLPLASLTYGLAARLVTVPAEEATSSVAGPFPR